MTREEVISVLEESKRQNEIIRDNPNTFFKASDIVTGEKNAQKRIDALNMEIYALRQQENECVECSGIVYLQTNSGKIVPLGQRCGEKITPPCYVPDGDGCSYQIYGDNNDEPIDRCKSCPLCQSDKVRHKQEQERNDPITLDELRQMDGEPVWVVYGEDEGMWALVEVCEESIFLTNNLGGRTEYAADVELEDDGLTVYRQKPDEVQK